MKKFSRMPKSESGGLGGGSGSGSGTGGSNFIGRIFSIGRYQVTVDELIAEAYCESVQNSSHPSAGGILSPNLEKRLGTTFCLALPRLHFCRITLRPGQKQHKTFISDEANSLSYIH
ncbi:hypothetical protein P4O66_001805 [Electrophorus voltai]|uniref:Uncharacterized protein n=1 Tax=Electrophorus voltai TaxID=2609070 RepID=A0AAD8Z631_9TELE|nr:hypothetical protein P4O66_001805 [Electrophorus voltai]